MSKKAQRHVEGGHKVCAYCGETKPEDEFGYKRAKNGRVYRKHACKACLCKEERDRRVNGPKGGKPGSNPMPLPVDGKKGCSKCHMILSVDDFYKAAKEKSGLGSWCKHCIREYQDRRRELGRQSHLKRRFGLSPEAFNALFAGQGGRCAICKGEFDTGYSYSERSCHVDHDHATGMVRGLLCLQCNAGLGHYKDSPDLLMAAAAYIENHCASVTLAAA